MVPQSLECKVLDFRAIILPTSPIFCVRKLALNIKGLTYRTVWVQMPDIEPACKEIGAKLTETKRDGTSVPTFPAIVVYETNTVVSDSLEIARYLDYQCPNTI